MKQIGCEMAQNQYLVEGFVTLPGIIPLILISESRGSGIGLKLTNSGTSTKDCSFSIYNQMVIVLQRNST